jgi:hypothetical protein
LADLVFPKLGVLSSEGSLFELEFLGYAIRSLQREKDLRLASPLIRSLVVSLLRKEAFGETRRQDLRHGAARVYSDGPRAEGKGFAFVDR